ncbi:hypothetical protein MKEN_01173300 [Mycena kentingensis (nom. inval.)]|nr:hypothetical protein MKEN_01173300 [Mycena kentingensis (nom. inval.)]
MPAIPPEILQQFIEHISDPYTLKDCALAASILRQPAQKQLFRKLELGGEPGSYERFAARFSASQHAHLALCVQELVIHLEYYPSSRKTTQAVLQALATAGNSLRKCSIQGIYYKRRWDQAEPALLEELFAWLPASGIRDIEVVNALYVPPATVYALLAMDGFASANFTNITLDDPRFPWFKPSYSTDNFPPLTHELRDLTLYGAADIANLLIAPQFLPCVGSLRSLTLRYNMMAPSPTRPPLPSAFADICAAASQTLVYLHFDDWLIQSNGESYAFLPATLPRLKHFSLGTYSDSVSAGHDYSVRVEPLADLIAAAFAPERTPALETFTFHVVFTYTSSGIHEKFLRRIDGIASARSSTCGKDVKVELKATFMDNDADTVAGIADLAHAVGESMPEASARGAVVVRDAEETFFEGRFVPVDSVIEWVDSESTESSVSV